MWVVGDDGGRLALDGPEGRERKRELRARLAAGELDELIFEAGVFRAVYPNANFLRFRDEDLAAFAASFAGQPFLGITTVGRSTARGGHGAGVGLGRLRVCAAGGADRAARHGGVSQRADGSFLDRVVLGEAVLCSVCGNEWLSRDCVHWPGQKYVVGDAARSVDRQRQVLCELIFVKPRGKETSAVNAPAVEGTGVRGVLAELMAAKQALWEGEMDEEERSPAEWQPDGQAAGGRTCARGGAGGGDGAAGGRRRRPMAAGDRAEVTALLSRRRCPADSAARGGVGQSAGRVGAAGGAAGSVRAMLPADWTGGGAGRPDRGAADGRGRRWKRSARCRGTARRAMRPG